MVPRDNFYNNIVIVSRRAGILTACSVIFANLPQRWVCLFLEGWECLYIFVSSRYGIVDFFGDTI